MIDRLCPHCLDDDADCFWHCECGYYGEWCEECAVRLVADPDYCPECGRREQEDVDLVAECDCGFYWEGCGECCDPPETCPECGKAGRPETAIMTTLTDGAIVPVRFYSGGGR